MLDIYKPSGFLIITFEWVVWLRNDVTGVILTHIDTFQSIFSKVRKIIKQPIVVNAPVASPLRPPPLNQLRMINHELQTP